MLVTRCCLLDSHMSAACCVQLWEDNSKRGIWLKVPTMQSQLIHPAMQLGFGFHHAEPGYLMLTRWLPDSPSTLPANASHQVTLNAPLSDTGVVQV